MLKPLSILCATRLSYSITTIFSDRFQDKNASDSSGGIEFLCDKFVIVVFLIRYMYSALRPKIHSLVVDLGLRSAINIWFSGKEGDILREEEG